MSFTITGKVVEITPTMQVSEKFKKRELVVEYIENPQYPEYLKFEIGGDKCSLLDSISTNQEVTIDFNLRGRPWTDKTGKKSYFNSLQIWKIVGHGQAPVSQTAQVIDLNSAPEDDDLPF